MHNVASRLITCIVQLGRAQLLGSWEGTARSSGLTGPCQKEAVLLLVSMPIVQRLFPECKADSCIMSNSYHTHHGHLVLVKLHHNAASCR